ncbi:hypothetical protein [Variovorax sp. E3]|uniref:hypothetical protein n=1 Tax=Variovorax sp. E3 TaxID=1914993 RepID=UPI0018DEBAD8|nr:hypothetical protein [Variovorax sp. E3]
MSTALLDQVVAFVREKFTKREVVTVQEYGGEFSGEEIDKVSFTCPAIFIAQLGWTPGATGNRLAGRNTRTVSMSAFVVTKSGRGRADRMREAMQLAERLTLALRAWIPQDSNGPYAIAPLDEDPTAENLYGRAVDKAGLALWLVRWQQDVRSRVPPGQAFELLSVEVHSNAHQGVVPESQQPDRPPLSVSHEITFPPQEP